MKCKRTPIPQSSKRHFVENTRSFPCSEPQPMTNGIRLKGEPITSPHATVGPGNTGTQSREEADPRECKVCTVCFSYARSTRHNWKRGTVQQIRGRNSRESAGRAAGPTPRFFTGRFLIRSLRLRFRPSG
uniref:Uncharacterized protein n=1 Tax=Sus scrofa TaxID=9823 RepID=A0A481CUR5_PIG